MNIVQYMGIVQIPYFKMKRPMHATEMLITYLEVALREEYARSLSFTIFL
jgi:hypothetical protein